MKKILATIIFSVLVFISHTHTTHAAIDCSKLTSSVTSPGKTSDVVISGKLEQKLYSFGPLTLHYAKIENPGIPNPLKNEVRPSLATNELDFSAELQNLTPGLYYYQLDAQFEETYGSGGNNIKIVTKPISDRCQFVVAEAKPTIRAEVAPVSVSGKKAVITLNTFGILADAPSGVSMRLGTVVAKDTQSKGECTPALDLTKPISIKKGDSSVQTEFELSPGIYCVTLVGKVTFPVVGDIPLNIDCKAEATDPDSYSGFCETFGVEVTVPPNLTSLNPEADLYGCKQTGTDIYCPLQPLPGTIDPVTKGIDVRAGFGNYLKGMIVLFMGIIGVLSVVMIVIGGIQYMSTVNIGEKEGSKSQITNAIFGLVLALGSYAILNTINPNLVNINVGVPSAQLELNDDVDSAPTDVQTVSTNVSGKDYSYAGLCGQVGRGVATTVSVDGGATKRVVWPIKSGLFWPRDDGKDSTVQDPTDTTKNITVIAGTERTQIENFGVTVKSNICNKVGDQCTSVYGLPQSAIQGLKKLKQNCPTCDIVVSGGTECWLHKTHGPGLEPVDLRKSDALINYITKNGKKNGKDYTIGTTVFYDEDSLHYHVRKW